MQELRLKGGARVGFRSASWPLCRLLVTAERLELHLGLAGRYVFAPADVISIQPTSSFTGKAIRITHRVAEYSDVVEFTTLGGPPDLLAAIAATGFVLQPPPLPNRHDSLYRTQRPRGIFPFRPAFVIGVVVGWNALLLPGAIRWIQIVQKQGGSDEAARAWGQGRYATIFMITVCIMLLFFEPFKRWALREDHTLDGLRPSIWFVMAVLGLFLVAQLSSGGLIGNR